MRKKESEPRIEKQGYQRYFPSDEQTTVYMRKGKRRNPKNVLFLKKRFCLFLERGEGKEKERERNINVWLPLEHLLLGTRSTTQACALTGNRTRDPLVRRLLLNPLSHTSQSPKNVLNLSKEIDGDDTN